MSKRLLGRGAERRGCVTGLEHTQTTASVGVAAKAGVAARSPAVATLEEHDAGLCSLFSGGAAQLRTLRVSRESFVGKPARRAHQLRETPPHLSGCSLDKRMFAIREIASIDRLASRAIAAAGADALVVVAACR
jgi:hypothetical protein